MAKIAIMALLKQLELARPRRWVEMRECEVSCVGPVSNNEKATSMGAALKIVQDMEAALGRSETDMSPWFHDDFVWDGNRGCGVKHGVKDFFEAWQKPFRAAFSDRAFVTERWLEDGNWVACFGRCDARHTGTFLGIEPTGQLVRIPYIDFWEIRDGRIAYNKVSVDFADVAAQLGRDLFGGEGWEKFGQSG